MKTPVIIAAYNEADRIGSTLRGLDSDTVTPYVVVNGAEGSFETAAQATSYGATVIVLEGQGKFPAIQRGLQLLPELHDKEAYGHPILFTDADSQPLFKNEWAPTLSKAVAGSVACSAAGVILFNDGPLLQNTIRNGRRLLRVKRDQSDGTLQSSSGANMAINLANDQHLVEKVLDSPHIWPGEDRYLLHLVATEQDRFTQLTTMGSVVLTSSRMIGRFGEMIGMTPEEKDALHRQRYIARMARGATHYFNDITRTLVPHEKDN